MHIAVDIDGTLFDCRDRKHLIPADPTRSENWVAYNAARHLDVPRHDMIGLVKTLLWGSFVTAVTSVGDAARTAVVDQLTAAGLDVDDLNMRPMDDHRTAFDYKMERYKELKPDLIIEDNPQIVDGLRKEGFTVLQIDSLDPTV